MKTKLYLTGFILMGALCAQAATTNDLAATLRNGLFEEQVNHDMNAAIATYQSLVTQFDKDRLLTATAVFRLGECYRTLGKTNEAAAQYQRVIREFPDQTTLVTLSRENLVALGNTPQTALATSNDSANATALAMAKVEEASLKAQIERLKKMSPADLRVLVQQKYPNPVLSKLMQQLNEAEQHVTQMRGAYTTNNPGVVNAMEIVQTINKQVDAQVQATLEIQLAVAQDTVKNLSATSTVSNPAREEQKRLLEEEIKLAEQQQDKVKKNVELGLVASEELVTKQREVLALRQRLAALGDSTDIKSGSDEEDQEIRRIQTMIQNSPDLINAVSDVGPDRSTPLVRAAKSGQLRVAQYLLDNNADVNLQTPLVSAAVAGHKAMVELLLHHGANEDSRNRALQIAAANGFKAVAEVLIENKADVNSRYYDGSTLLYSAAGQGRSALIELLIAKGANVNVTNNSGVTPLGLAAKKDLASVKTLLVAKANPNGGTSDLPLHVAVGGNDAAIVEALLKAGADANSSALYHGQNYTATVTPLAIAINGNKTDSAKLLLAAKADPNGKDRNGSPLILSATSKPEILKALLDAGADPNVYNRDGQTPLVISVNGYDDSVNVLLSHGADKEAGYPLVMAVAYRDLKAAEALLKAGANANVRYKELNRTPLHVATLNGDLEMATLLLAYKADPNLRDDDGYTPLTRLNADPLIRNGNSAMPVSPQLLNILRKHGALDNLPMFDRIQVARPSANFSQTVFWKGTNDWNRFTLLETILNLYQSSYSPRPVGGGSISVMMSMSERLPFPDFGSVAILRHTPGSTNETRMVVNLLNSTNGVDCSKDVPLEFGDVVEIPEREHALSEQPIGLSPAQESTIRPCLMGDVQLVTRAQKIQLTVFPDSSSRIGVRLNNEDARRALLSSSDLAHVKVTRRDPATGKTREWILDCTNPQSSPDLWLRNGDVIEVPEK